MKHDGKQKKKSFKSLEERNDCWHEWEFLDLLASIEINKMIITVVYGYILKEHNKVTQINNISLKKKHILT